MLDSSSTIREETTNFDFPELTFGRLKIVLLEEWSSKYLIVFM
jgi:hypothetical protein